MRVVAVSFCILLAWLPAWIEAADRAERLADRVQRLIAELDPGHGTEVRFLAAHGLKELGPAASLALPVLGRVLRDSDEDLRVAAAEAIARIGPDVSLIPDLVWAYEHADGNGSVVIVDALVRVGPLAIPSLVELLGVPPLDGPDGPDQGWVASDVVAEAVARFGPRVVPSLIQALARPRLRGGAAAALGLLGPDARAAVPVLIRLAAHPDPAVRYRVAEALGAMGNHAREAVPVLAEILRSEMWSGAAIRALGRIGPASASAVPELRDLLRRTRHYSDQVEILNALGAIGPSASSALPDLREIAQRGGHLTAPAAEQAIQKIECVRWLEAETEHEEPD